MKHTPQAKKQGIAYTGMAAFGGLLLGAAVQTAVHRVSKGSSKHPALLTRWQEYKKRMYLQGQTIYHRYGRIKHNISNKAMQQANNDRQTTNSVHSDS